MTVEKKELKIKLNNNLPTIKPYFILIAIILLIPVAITFFIRTWYAVAPILRFNVTGGFIGALLAHFGEKAFFLLRDK